MKVSLCTVVYNEEHRIRQFLDNAWPHVDEIVIVNQESTDETVHAIFDWQNENGLTHDDISVIHDRHWGYCEPSRIRAHNGSTGDWILVLDADERVSDNTALWIESIRQGTSSHNFRGMRLKRSLWISGVHYWTGDYQYRFFARNAVRYLDELHTEPQPTIREKDIYSPPFVGIWHEKSFVEQARDENAYSELINPYDPRKEAKLALNVYSQMLQDAGLTPEEADKAAQDGALKEFGIAPTYEPHEEIK